MLNRAPAVIISELEEKSSNFLNTLAALPADPLLGLSTLYQQDSNPQKIDQGVGVYKNELNQAPVMQAVKQAERVCLNKEQTKAYTAPVGDLEYVKAIEHLLLGNTHPAISSRRIASIQTPGGSCALRIAADFIQRCNATASLWLPNQTWVNHQPLMARNGLVLKSYPYYSEQQHNLDFDAMLTALAQVPNGDVVLLQGCCHNPTGEDLSITQWHAVADLASDRGFIPLVDIAYQGLATSLQEDAAGLRLLAEALPLVMVTASCSKNFAIYRERVGVFSTITANKKQASVCLSQALDIVRGYYFVPPAHGANVVKTILCDSTLREQWLDELTTMRLRIAMIRNQFDQMIQNSELAQHFSHIATQKGMFSFLGLTPQQVIELRNKHSIFMAASSRVNLSGINDHNIDYLVSALESVKLKSSKKQIARNS